MYTKSALALAAIACIAPAHAAFIITDPDTSGGISPDATITDEYGNTNAAAFAALPGVTVVQMNFADNTGGNILIPGTVTVTGEYTASINAVSSIQFGTLADDSLGTKMSSDGGYVGIRNQNTDTKGVFDIDLTGVDAVGLTANDFEFGGSVTVFSGTDVLTTANLDGGINFFGYTREAGEGEITKLRFEMGFAPSGENFFGFQIGIDDLAVVKTIPEPGAFALFATGLAAVVARRRH